MKTVTRKEIIKRLDRLRQTYARYEGAKKKNGIWVNTCVTCGAVFPCDKTNGGHFCSRSCYPLRWDEKNVHCQCVRCNLYKNGAYIEYSQWFIKKYGEETFNRYVDVYRKWQQGKLPALKINELRELHDFWLAKGRELEQKIGPTFPKSWEPLNDPYILTSGGLPDNS